MSKVVKEIEISDEDCLKLEKVHYEYLTMKDNIAYLISLHSTEPDYIESESFIEYQNKEVQKNIEYDNIKNEITIKYIPEDILEQNKYQWNADFDNKKLIIVEI